MLQKVTELIVHARPNITDSFAQKAKVIKIATGENIPNLPEKFRLGITCMLFIPAKGA